MFCLNASGGSRIAATLPENERTLHCRHFILLRITKESMCYMKTSDSRGKRFQNARLRGYNW